MSTAANEATGTKHEPGDWHVIAVAKGRVLGDETAEGAEKFLVCAGHATVATVYRARDARLIALLPALLDFLRREGDFLAAVEGCDECEDLHCDGHFNGDSDFSKERDELLAKAAAR